MLSFIRNLNPKLHSGDSHSCALRDNFPGVIELAMGKRKDFEDLTLLQYNEYSRKRTPKSTY